MFVCLYGHTHHINNTFELFCCCFSGVRRHLGVLASWLARFARSQQHGGGAVLAKTAILPKFKTGGEVGAHELAHNLQHTLRRIYYIISSSVLEKQNSSPHTSSARISAFSTLSRSAMLAPSGTDAVEMPASLRSAGAAAAAMISNMRLFTNITLGVCVRACVSVCFVVIFGVCLW